MLVPTSGVGQRGKLDVISSRYHFERHGKLSDRAQTKAILATFPKTSNKFLHLCQIIEIAGENELRKMENIVYWSCKGGRFADY